MLISIFIAFALGLMSVLGGPLTPEQYRVIIKQGFATNWFKTCEPLSKYNDKNIQDIYSKGFRNVRLRSRADLYTAPYTSTKFSWFLKNLTAVVDKCLEIGVAPIISWIHHKDEANASEQARKDYVKWWTAVANQLKNRDYRLSFNLFTELGIDECKKTSSCAESLRSNSTKYNQWTSDVLAAIRATGGKNRKRILILGSPGKTAKDLVKINQSFFNNDDYLMAEWHIYASGPNKEQGGQKYWNGDGIKLGRQNVDAAIKHATDFTNSRKVLTYLGAWMPTDNENGALSESEVVKFGKYFAKKMKSNKIPWSLNVLDRYYNTKKSQWIVGKQNISGTMIDMDKVLQSIINVM